MVTNLRVQLSSVRASKENCKPILLLGTADCLDCSSGQCNGSYDYVRAKLTARMAWPRRQRVRRPSKAWPPRILALVARATCSRSTTMRARAGVTMFFFYSFSVLIVRRSFCDGPSRRQAHAFTGVLPSAIGRGLRLAGAAQPDGTTRETPSSDGARRRIYARTPQIPNAVRFLPAVDRGLGVGVWCLADHIA
jgi:hypothetical protein